MPDVVFFRRCHCFRRLAAAADAATALLISGGATPAMLLLLLMRRDSHAMRMMPCYIQARFAGATLVFTLLLRLIRYAAFFALHYDVATYASH